MKRHAIAITAALLGAIWLVSIGVILFYVAGLAGVPALLGAIVAQIAAFLVSGSLLLTTNTRRPWGIDPNVAPPAPRPRRDDPFAATTDELRPRVVLGDGDPYGSRKSDDIAVVRRLAMHFEQDDASRPKPDTAPKWALDLVEQNAADIFPDAPKESEGP